jgi:hypothetical protein
LHQALHTQPAFYQDALAVSTVQQQQAGDEFERNLLRLHNDVQQSERWERVFSDDQINGWLAVDLPENFPDLLPPSVSQPRVALTPETLQIGFLYRSDQLSTVVSLRLEITLAAEPNTLAICLRQAQAGWVPLPLKDFIDHVSEAARRADIRLRWAQQDGAPVALITLPARRDSDQQEPFLLQLIELGQGTITIAGKSVQEAEQRL